MPDSNTNITISSSNLQSIAQAAESMNESAKQIADSMAGVKASVDTLNRSLESFADQQSSDDYDAKLREEAERMYAESAAADHPEQSPGEILAILTELKGMVAELASARQDAGRDSMATAESILGDTVSGSADEEYRNSVISRMDAMADTFAGISAQLGSVKTWIETSAQQTQAVIRDSVPDNRDDAAGEEQVDTPDPMAEIASQYAELNRTIGELGEYLKTGLTTQTRDELIVPKVDVEVKTETVADAGTNDSTERQPVPDIKGAILDSVGPMADRISARLDTSGPVVSELSSIDNGIAALADRIDGMRDGIMDKQEVHEPVQPQMQPDSDKTGRVEDGIAAQTHTIEKVSEAILTERETVRELASVDQPRPVVESDYHDDFETLHRALTDTNSGISGSIDAGFATIGKMLDGMVSIIGHGQEEPEKPIHEYPAESISGDVVASPAEHAERFTVQPLAQRDSMQSPSGETADGRVESAVPPDVESAGKSIGAAYETEAAGPSAREYNVLQPAPMQPNDNAQRDVQRATSEPDRYGDTGVRPIRIEISESKANVEPDHRYESMPGTVDAKPAKEYVEQPMAINPENIGELKSALTEGMVAALTDPRFTAIISGSIEDMVKRTVRAMVG